MADRRVTRIMGILNCTPDSFYTGSRRTDPGAAVETAFRMIRDGADIIDVGGESSRPGSSGVSDDEQTARILPVIREIRRHSGIPLSVDTRSARVAESALDAGADIINDISAGTSDPIMLRLAAEWDVPLVLMHMRGTPENMQDDPRFDDPVSEVAGELRGLVQRALDAGVRKENIIVDPGIGFGKRFDDNLKLLSGLESIIAIGQPVLVGLSRKSFLGAVLAEENTRLAARPAVPDGRMEPNPAGDASGPTGTGPEDRLIATVAAHAWCLSKGIDILRVHDVLEARQTLAVWESIRWVS